MPKKPADKNHRITVVVNGEPITVMLYSPRGKKRTWYAYWETLSTARSTRQTDYSEAVKVAEAMVRNGGRCPELSEALLSNDEFEEIQKRHFGKKHDPKAVEAAQKTLGGCLEAIEAFKLIMKIDQICLATPDDCERFQHNALNLPAGWRRRKLADSSNGSEKQRSEDDTCEATMLSPNTILKWSTALRAAFERANRNAGKKCVRGVVPEHKLLEQNPWSQFTWIDGKAKPIRHFDAKELVSLIDWFETRWEGLTFAPAYLKVMLWSWARRSEVSNLKWQDERSPLSETHFKSVGKRGVTKWFRIPNELRKDLENIRCESDFVFGDYTRQLIEFYRKREEFSSSSQVRADFSPVNLGEWMYRRIAEWSKDSPKGSAYLHVFRKTGLQLALSGEYAMSDVARDASITSGVMEASYAQEFDEELWRKSNRTYRRIRASLTQEVAVRYGYGDSERERLLEELDLARMELNWEKVSHTAKLIERLDHEKD